MNANTNTYRIVSDLFGGEQFATREELQTVADMFGTRLEFVGTRVFARWVREWDDEARELTELVAVLHGEDNDNDSDEYDGDEESADNADIVYRLVSDSLGGEEFATRKELEVVTEMFGGRIEFVGDRALAHWFYEDEDEGEPREEIELVAVVKGSEEEDYHFGDDDEDDDDEAEAQEAEGDAPVSYYRHVSWFGGGELFATKDQLEAIALELRCELEFVGDKVFAHWVREDDEDGHGYSELVALLIDTDDDE